MSPLLSRLLSPSGFVLALLLLLLPFVGVSCADQDLGTLDGSYTGVDLATGGAPSFQASGPIADNTIAQEIYPDPGVQLLTILVIVLLVAGLAAALLPTVRIRALAGALLAVLAAVLVVITQLAAQSNLVTSMQELLLTNLFSAPQELAQAATQDYLSNATTSRTGFWLTTATLLVVVAINILALRPPRTPRATGAPQQAP